MEKLHWLPMYLRNPLVLFRNKYLQIRQKRALMQLSCKPVKKIIIGAAGTTLPGWASGEKEVLDLLIEKDWACYFKPDSIDAILAEHVWEHLTTNEAIIAARNCYKYLKSGEGYLRVAVPDGFHPVPSYIDCVKPNGTGIGAIDHKALYNYRTITQVFVSVGFDVTLLEYFDEQGEFHHKEWNPSDGLIQRSKQYDWRNTNRNLIYTSVILDAKKPLFSS
jgi:predicted SAM-dependent methyltransferase